MSDISLRLGLPSEAQIVAAQRRAMFIEMGRATEGLERMLPEFAAWVASRIESGEYQAWFALNQEGRIVGGAGLWFMTWLPHPVPARSQRGYVLNVYVEPAYRRRGVARRLMAAILDACRQAGAGVVTLHASDEGRPLYESLGFKVTEEMRLVLDDPPTTA